ncbi:MULTISPECIES: hypothetical protein [unclassified Xenorhabdus]|uniref:hypothetical protein n=1 Tax=unclassified Xenorhabdus TaxID=2632833 RepID=UPI000C051CBF|nr:MULTISPECIES: hypothetical protein [unclassified Xenorhabdus]MCC8381128.1 hypothetical protein [Xenorhabdus sp. PB30.3]PHM52866.1 hypothetical protein Xekk_02984 [Xenorhabdus sp. KK7.4]
MNKICVLLLSAVMLCSGCATIVGEKTQLVQINSQPSGAEFSIKDETGQEITRGNTPQSVMLAKSTGHYFGGKTYQITFTKENFQSVTLPLVAKANGWYIGGNFVFGGLIGWLVVDPFNGGMYTLHPKAANVTLPASKTLSDIK